MVTAILLLFTSTVKPQYVSLNKNEIKKLATLIKTDPGVKKKYEALKALADAAINQVPNPVDTITSEGHLVTDPKKILTQKALADMNKVYALAFTYKLTRKQKYLQKCMEYIVAWASVNHGTGNPINDTKLDLQLEAYDLVKDEINLSKREITETWLSSVANREIANPRFKSTNKSAHNNWNSHRIKVVGMIAYILGNENYKLFTDTSMKTQILKNLYANGAGMDFEERDALHYHIYTLEPLLKTAILIKRATGIDYFTHTSLSGSSIQKSVTFLIPFATGVQVHHEFVNSKTPFDRQRAANKEPGYSIGDDFNPQTAIEVLCYAAYFTPGYSGIVKKILGTPDAYPTWQSVLNAVSMSPFNN